MQACGFLGCIRGARNVLPCHSLRQTLLEAAKDGDEGKQAHCISAAEALTLALGFRADTSEYPTCNARADIASAAVSNRPALAKSTTLITRQNALHIAAEQGHLQVLASILEALCISATTPHAADEPDDGPQVPAGLRWHLQTCTLYYVPARGSTADVHACTCVPVGGGADLAAPQPAGPARPDAAAAGCHPRPHRVCEVRGRIR